MDRYDVIIGAGIMYVIYALVIWRLSRRKPRNKKTGSRFIVNGRQKILERIK